MAISTHDRKKTAVVPNTFDDLSAAEITRSSTLAGLGLGALLGVTFWSHSPDMMHVAIAGIMLLICLVAGWLIGLFVGKTVED